MKYSRILRMLVVTLILSLLLMAVPALPVHAANDLTLSVNQGQIGTQFTVTGSGFSPSTETAERHARIIFAKENVVTGNYIDTHVLTYKVLGSQIISWNTDAVPGYFQGTYTVPATLTSGTVDQSVTSGTYYIYITITTAQGVGTYIYSKATFTVVGGQIVLDPEEGPVDYLIEISGTDFAPDEEITIEFAGDEVDIEDGDDETDSSGDFSSFIIVPEIRGGAHDITVIVGSGTTAFEVEAEFTVEPDIIITPQSGEAGTSVTISGTGFARRPKEAFIYFNNNNISVATMDTRGSFSTTFLVPEGLPAGVYTIEAEDEDENLASVSFTLNVPPPETPTPEPEPTPPPPPAAPVLSISQSSDIIGSLIGIGGVGFTPNAIVTIKYDDVEVASVAAGADGIVMATFNAPPSTHGDHTITVSDGTHTSTTIYTVESIAPDTPPPLSPEMGVKLKSPGTFDWEDVTDDSKPVTYVLQIATDDAFEAAYIVMDITDIELSTYTLTEAEELKLAGRKDAYYWRIQAVDAASNKSEWTGAGEFYVGGGTSEFPSWALYTIIGIGAVLIFGIGYWLGRRTAFYY